MRVAPLHAAARAAAGPVNTLAAFRVVPTGAALGAEIHGVDVSLPVPEDVKAALRKAWADHLVLLIWGQHLDAGRKADNRCCMHYRTQVDSRQRCVMHRTTIKGEPIVAPW